MHHILGILERPDLALEDGNLITLCAWNHSLADKGEIEIPLKEIKNIIREQEKLES